MAAKVERARKFTGDIQEAVGQGSAVSGWVCLAQPTPEQGAGTLIRTGIRADQTTGPEAPR